MAALILPLPQQAGWIDAGSVIAEIMCLQRSAHMVCSTRSQVELPSVLTAQQREVRRTSRCCNHKSADPRSPHT